ncbi:helix-turn-helix transcriptional regulator [Ahrensia marina]|uniref:helix-turn-helix transcriptional regulator n=1 Tax=Ahrensia marina TaxID=1514904 RepID=UPI0035D0A167
MLEAINKIQAAILSGYDSPTDVWADDVCSSMGALLGTDHLYFIEPEEPSDQSGQERLGVYSRSIGQTFADGIASHFEGFDDDGFSLFREDYASALHRIIRASGVGAYHDAPLYNRRIRESMELHQEVFKPVGLERQMAISAPLVRGEAMLIAGFGHKDFPEHDDERHQILQLLTPAFEAAIAFRARLKRSYLETRDAMEGAGKPLAVVSIDGALLFLSAELQTYLAADDNRKDMLAAILSMAQDSTQALLRNPGRALVQPVRRAKIGQRHHTLRARIGRAFNGNPEVHIWVEPQSGRALNRDLARAYGLTPRECEVAALIAEGLRDKEIARRLSISPHTARRHSEALLRKTELSNRANVGPLLFQYI